ncbi:hypothetical protein [Paraburkholderia sp. BL10I2N1]|uniref:hypothetical protein n=1 Tax=Paraburkholderia sp. BL10I2N1 TaxID=1938796 RepID=UPI00105DD38B|nr:hypothetical protein [Paraburkholderia sp. BL10I2N1]TDN69082.1 hypothetical protein B0G77_2451 [Paraburkholderia sp. BL10I2N1]
MDYEASRTATRGYIDEDLKRIYDLYIDNQMRGCTPIEAALRVHVLEEHVAKWVRTAESDPYVIERKRAALKALDANTAWSAETAIVHLLRLVENPYEKGSVKVAAIDRLNVLLGITEVDAAGNTRKTGHTLADFYKMTADQPAKPH